MKQEPFFLINDFLENDLPELQQVIKKINGPKIKDIDRAIFLRDFTNSLFKAYRKQIYEEQVEKSKNNGLEKLRLERKRNELIQKLKQAENFANKEKPIIFSDVSKKPIVKSGFTGTNYNVTQPKLSKEDIKILEILKNEKGIIDEEIMKSKFNSEVEKNKLNLTEEDFDKIRYYLIRDLKNYGKISPLMEDKKITEIICNFPNSSVLVTYDSHNEVPTNISFMSDEEINNFILSMAKKTNQKIENDNPFLNAKLGDFDFQATLKSEFVKPRFVLVRSI